MEKESKKVEITLGSYFGNLFVTEKDGKCYWCNEDYDGYPWTEIPEELYNCLIENKDKVGNDVIWESRSKD